MAILVQKNLTRFSICSLLLHSRKENKSVYFLIQQQRECGNDDGWSMVEFLSVPGSEADDADNISESRAETLPLCSRLQTPQKPSRLRQPIPVDELWTYVAHQKTVGCRDLKAEYEVCLLYRISGISWDSLEMIMCCMSSFSSFVCMRL